MSLIAQRMPEGVEEDVVEDGAGNFAPGVIAGRLRKRSFLDEFLQFLADDVVATGGKQDGVELVGADLALDAGQRSLPHGAVASGHAFAQEQRLLEQFRDLLVEVGGMGDVLEPGIAEAQRAPGRRVLDHGLVELREHQVVLTDDLHACLQCGARAWVPALGPSQWHSTSKAPPSALWASSPAVRGKGEPARRGK